MHPRAPRPLLGNLASTRPANFMQPSFVNSIQRGTVAYSSASTGTATIAAVDPARSRLRYLGMTQATASSDFSVASANAVLTNATAITINGLTAGTLTASYEVSCYNAGYVQKVQRGVITWFAAGIAQATIAAVQTTRAELSHLGAYTPSSGAPPTADQWAANLLLTNATTVSASKVAAVQSVSVSFEVVQIP